MQDLDASGNRRVLEEFGYAAANVPSGCVPGTRGCDAKAGKLSSAFRYNRSASLGVGAATGQQLCEARCNAACAVGRCSLGAKIDKQLGKRGWDADGVHDVINNPQPATAYVDDKSNYVVANSRSKCNTHSREKERSGTLTKSSCKKVHPCVIIRSPPRRGIR